MAMNKHILALEALRTGYSGRLVSGGVSFRVRSGEMLALLGPNGSGKTTLFKTILGLIPPLGGKVLLDGSDLTPAAANERARLFGYVPQAAAGYFPYTVREIVMMGRTPHIRLFSAPGGRDRGITEAAIGRLNLHGLAERDFTRISGGERQLTLVARALAQEPAFLVMDEPTASLDFANQLRMLDLIRALAGSGIGIIFSTHHPDQALAVATHAALLNEGALQAIGEAKHVLTSEQLSLLFGVALSVERVADALVCVPTFTRSNQPLSAPP
jgi:iron complex transport system ATP-binding protein